METLKCAISLAALVRIWRNEGVTEDNRLPFFCYLLSSIFIFSFSYFL